MVILIVKDRKEEKESEMGWVKNMSGSTERKTIINREKRNNRKNSSFSAYTFGR